MATVSETLTIGTSATKLYPSAATAEHDSVGSFSPPSDVYIGDESVTTSTGRLITSTDEVSWRPGREDLWAVASGSTDVEVLYTQVHLNELGGIINVAHTTPGS